MLITDTAWRKRKLLRAHVALWPQVARHRGNTPVHLVLRFRVLQADFSFPAGHLIIACSMHSVRQPAVDTQKPPPSRLIGLF
jgi:hypothetical protein